MIRRTRLMSKAGVLMVRVEVFDGDILRSTSLKVSTRTTSQSFTTMTKAVRAFRVMSRYSSEGPRLQKAA